MSHKPKNHIPDFDKTLEAYADAYLVDLHQYSPYHFRLMDGGYVVLDCWTTGRYYIMITDYAAMTDGNIIERGGEKGQLPRDTKKLIKFLNEIFFPEGELNENI